MSLTFPYELVLPALIGTAFPLVLMPLTRIPRLKSRNGVQFFLATVAVVSLWIAGAAASPGPVRPHAVADWVLSGLVLASVLLMYLEAWALLSRGYTLALLLSLLEAGEPLDGRELARRYRGGDGLPWIMRHRLEGLLAHVFRVFCATRHNAPH